MPPPGAMYGASTSNGGSLFWSITSASALQPRILVFVFVNQCTGLLGSEQLVPLPKRFFFPREREHDRCNARRFAANDGAGPHIVVGIDEPIGSAIACGNALLESLAGGADEQVAIHNGNKRIERSLCFVVISGPWRFNSRSRSRCRNAALRIAPDIFLSRY